MWLTGLIPTYSLYYTINYGTLLASLPWPRGLFACMVYVFILSCSKPLRRIEAERAAQRTTYCLALLSMSTCA